MNRHGEGPQRATDSAEQRATPVVFCGGCENGRLLTDSN